MARGGPSKLPRQQGKTYNAKQAQARKERKSNNPNGVDGPSNLHDVFEYVTNQEEAKRNGRGDGSSNRSEKKNDRLLKRASKFDTADQEKSKKMVESDEDEDDADQEATRFLQTVPTWNEDNYQVRSEDDEEIDSDEAFGESDDEKFEGWKFGSGKKATTFGTAKEAKGEEGEKDEEDSSEAEEGEDDDLMDLSKMLEGSDDDGEDSDEESGSENEEDDSDDERLQQRMQNISAMSGNKRRAEEMEEGSSKATKRRVLAERTEAVPEGEWNVPSARGGASLLTIDDLMKPIREQGGTTFTSVRDAAKILKSKKGTGGKQAIASKKGGGALQAPLPTILQDRIDRAAAYEETKAEVQGWQPTIKRIREAEHLSFPLQADSAIKPSTALMTSQFKATNAFERDIAAMLEREGLSEKKLTEAEELQMNERGMSKEEIQERRNELRKMRDLLFREEQKAKRVSKIKSKTFRKIARKQRERDVAKAKEAGIILDEEGEEENGKESEKEKAARLRAKERATLKHKNTGKWAQNIIEMQGSNPLSESRNAIEEQLRKGEQLRRRIQGKNSDEEVEGEADDSEGEEESQNEEENVFDELRAIEKKNEVERRAEEEEMQGKKGVWGMKFMKDARDRKAKHTQDEVDNLEREMRELEDSDKEDDSDALDQTLFEASANPGRRTFATPSSNIATTHRAEQDDGEVIIDGSAEKTAILSKPIIVRDNRAASPQAGHDDSVNPWLSTKPTTKLSRKKNESTVSKESSAQSKAANRIQKHIAKGDDERREAMEDAQLDIDPEARLTFRNGAQAKAKKGKKAASKVHFVNDSDNPDDDDASLVDEPVAIRGRGPTAIQQRDLVAEAFAGDDVTADFAAEKAAIIEADAPQSIDTTLPGWGTWGGKGVRVNKKKAEAQKKRFEKMIPGLDPTKRKDASMTNVIINQKRDKKADKYRGKDVPFPYTSRAQYEMAMRNPLGPEWNTRTQHQKLTLPKVTTKPGKAIKPIGECRQFFAGLIYIYIYISCHADRINFHREAILSNHVHLVYFTSPLFT